MRQKNDRTRNSSTTPKKDLPKGENFQHWAREKRNDFFAKIASKHSCDFTATAHHATDKAETFVMIASFPMGSMTGAHKVSAMQLIEQFETHKRGMYSGALGYITPRGDFDFNVVIRSLLYNKNTHYLSASVGGAITILANAEDEYEECLLKAEALLELFG